VPRPPIAWRLLLGLAIARIALYLVSSGPLAYGYMSDELYYLDSTDHLAWGYVDHPPLSIAVLWLVRSVLGQSLLALRLVPALLGAGTIVLVGVLARELGGGRAAQGLAALAALLWPLLLGITAFYSMNAFEYAFWALGAFVVVRIVDRGEPRLWLVLGLVLGLGLLNKISMSWFGLGLGVGLLLTPQRRWLATPWPWAAAVVALAIFVPHLLWQAQHGWPTLEFIENATTQKMLAKSPVELAVDQLLVTHPLFVPLWLAGLVYCFVTTEGRRYQILAWIWITTGMLLLASTAVRSNYLGPAYLPLLAAGAVAFERVATRPRWRWLPAVAAVTFVVGGGGMAPLGLPLLPPEQYVAYERALGVSAPVEEKDELGLLPLHYALRFGWDEILGAVEQAHLSLRPEERARAVVLGSWFGDTGAVNVLGRARGLPPAISGHNSYWLWGPGEREPEIVLALSRDGDGLDEAFERVERVAEVDCRLCMPRVDALAVYVCRGPRRPLAEWWAEVKHYD
jgi:4-amino-4-deoxy-L-arabinose transferase-like glycosyltransferase